MQNLVGALGGIVAVWLFFRGFTELGIRLGHLNPILRYRRKKYQALCRNPLYNIESPLEMTAVLLVAAGDNGGISAETRHAILDVYENTFHLSKRDACALLISSTWLLQDGVELRENLKQVMHKSLRRFTREQAGSALSMIERIAGIDKARGPAKKQLLEKIRGSLQP